MSYLIFWPAFIWRIFCSFRSTQRFSSNYNAQFFSSATLLLSRTVKIVTNMILQVWYRFAEGWIIIFRGGIDSLAKSYKCLKAKMLRKKRSPDSTNYGAPPECQPDLLYGFRSRVSIVENQSCILDVTCTATGDRINAALLAKRRGQPNMSKHVQNMAKQSFAKRQSGEEFQSDAPPQCRAIRDPNNTCRAYLAVWYSPSFFTSLSLKVLATTYIIMKDF